YKWSKRVKLNNQSLLEAIEHLGDGLSTADLGHSLFKVRVRRENTGKRSGFRTIILYKPGDRAVFLYGFGKNEKDNIDKTELKYFRKLGEDLLALTPAELEDALSNNVLFNLEETP
ncbi:type II toxin-antitoxin system RelE/ParE family toxin, partial [Desulfatiferula olefinivorans]